MCYSNKKTLIISFVIGRKPKSNPYHFPEGNGCGVPGLQVTLMNLVIFIIMRNGA